MQLINPSFASAVALLRSAKNSTTHGKSGFFQLPSLSNWPVGTIALCLALAGIITGPRMCHGQSSSESTAVASENETKTDAATTRSWGAVATKKASVANLAPFFLPYLNNGPVFGLPGTDAGDFWHRTQLSGDWGGLRTDLARHGFFFDLYSISAYQNVTSGGLQTGSSFIQNTQLSINVDTGRAGLWPGGIFHVTLESRNGSSSPQNTFTAGSSVPQYTGLAFPGPFFVHDVLP